MNSKSDMLQLTVLVSGGDAIGKLFLDFQFLKNGKVELVLMLPYSIYFCASKSLSVAHF